LSRKKNEYASENKLLYILVQVLAEIKKMHEKSYSHGSIDATTIYVNVKNYKVKLSNYCFAGFMDGGEYP
jgi:serine/threonine protein kinase